MKSEISDIEDDSERRISALDPMDLKSKISNLRSPADLPIGIAVVFVHGTTWLSRLIESVCQSPFSHALIRFNFEDSDPVYFESLFARGVLGPRPIQHLWDYQRRHPCTWNTEIQLSWDPAVAQRKYLMAATYVGAAGYGEMQLIAMWLFKRFGWRVPRSAGRVVCSEFVARVIYPEWDMTSGDCTFDEIDPGTLYERLRKIASD